MSGEDPRPYLAPGEEPPLVLGLLGRAGYRASRALRALMQRLSRDGLVFRLLAAGSLVIAAGTPMLAFRRTPDFTGILGGLFAGLFMALLFWAAGLWLVAWARTTPKPMPEATQALADELERALEPTLRELELLRTQAIRAVKARSVTRLPAGIVILVVLYVMAQWNKGLDPLGMLFMAFVGAMIGEGWAVWKPDRDYTREYKARVLPQIARRFGDLTYRRASAGGIAMLRERGILPRHDSARVEDEIAGTHHGMPVSIVEARLKARKGKHTRVVFDGLLVQLTLPRSLTATTAIAPDRGALGNLTAQWRSMGLQQVRLEDPRFEARYEVYGSDQVEARALLTPAFMERLMALEALSGMAPPGATAQGNRLMIALPKRLGAGDLFEPPPYWKPSGGQALVRMSRDIRAVLAMADAVSGLDFWAEGRKRDAATAQAATLP